MRTSEGRPRLAEERRVRSARPGGRRRRRWIGPFVVLLVVGIVAGSGWVAWSKLQSELFSPSCMATAAGSSVSFSPEQTANAALIAALSEKRGLPARAATIAIATAIQESKLRNLAYGDRDSVGLFQQRPSMGWGTREQLLDPVFATNAFYDALVKVDGYEAMEITQVAQRVQKSAYPAAYADHEQEGRILASTLRGHSPAGLVCLLRPATQGADPDSVSADLASQFGVTGTASGPQVRVAATSPELAWAVGQWSVARAEAYGIEQVEVGDQTWTRGTGGAAESWSTGDGAPTPTGTTTVTIQLGGA